MAAIDERLAPLFRIGLLTVSLIASSSVPAADEVAMADPTERDFLSDMCGVVRIATGAAAARGARRDHRDRPRDDSCLWVS